MSTKLGIRNPYSEEKYTHYFPVYNNRFQLKHVYPLKIMFILIINNAVFKSIYLKKKYIACLNEKRQVKNRRSFFLWLSVDCNTNGEQTIDKNAKINETDHLSIYLGWWGIRN